ncbi:5'/3'-nucleotidase SurE [Trichophyton interdigitale MR816]|uniref:5'/3'-nucleotidase SurE n=1 Tax=Trichophyton interdigitale (strain MR816) TaxID=1215338 RepID=A0A059J5E9_TRIIM|nr:5'/3'-nucleotidase SurE [Trichophyton interdigitale H6]KDB22672.1 5'/3'-nucleotidase SurE [Trichophyton interdigitale MR816]
MHILVVNDDGPPSSQSSPYIHSLIHTLQSSGHVVSVVLPHRQRSWIGKAHLVGATVKPTYFHPGTLFQDDGTIHSLPRSEEGEGSEGDEWILIDSTPASCVQIGLFHYFQDRGPVDLVISGPNYGRNSTAVFSLSSGTIGGAMEAAVCGYKAIALSFAFSSRDHDPVVISEAANHSVRLIEHLYKNWTSGVDLYSINVPLEQGISKSKILYTNILDNRWSGSCFEAIDAELSGEDPGLQEHLLRQKEEGSTLNGDTSGTSSTRFQHKHFKWAPKFGDVYKSEQTSPPGNDGWAVRSGFTSVTPLKANFMHWPGCSGEITLLNETPIFYALVDCQDAYVQPLVMGAIQKQFKNIPYRMITSISELPDLESPVLQYRVYEKSDFEHVHLHPSTSLVNSYIIRKALIRKHFLSNTIANWITKYPDSVLQKHFKPTIDFELDYAEFLDEALLEAYELRESLEANEEKEECEKEWWILKPSMSDRAQGIRLFNSEMSLRKIFEEWEPEDTDSERSISEEPDGDLNGKTDTGVVTSQLRHFVVQPYVLRPLLLPSAANRKFHIRVYVLAVGSLKVYVYREMLALFADKSYVLPWEKGETDEDELSYLTRHLTNTCLQSDSTGQDAAPENVQRFWKLDDKSASVETGWKDRVYDQICAVTGEVFEAAARGMMVHFQPLPNAFEIFGVDYLVDETGNAWLLELNAFPDFRQTGDELKCEVIGKLFDEVVEIAVKPFFFPAAEKGNAAGEQAKSRFRLVADLNLGIK